jgi:hypothetical protein
MLDAHDAQRIVDAGNQTLRRRPFTVVTHRRLGRDHDLVALQRCERAADDALSAVRRRRINEIDAEINGFENKTGGLIFRLTGFDAQPTEAAGAKAGHADTHLSAAQSGVLHCNFAATLHSITRTDRCPSRRAAARGQKADIGTTPTKFLSID